MADTKLANVYNSDEELQQQILEQGGGGGGGDVDKAYVDRMDAEERQRAMAKENQLNEKIDNEITRATTEENNIKNDKQDKLTTGSDLSSVSDSTKISIVDLATKIITNFTLATLWNYIKGKITSVYYPVGTVIFNTGTNPGDTFGGTWSLYATGTKALYLDSTAGTSISEELPDPQITMGNAGEKKIGSNGAKLIGFAYTTSGSGQWGFGYSDSSEKNKSMQEFSLPYETASNHTHSITIDNATYKDNGKVRAEGITICAWKRTA